MRIALTAVLLALPLSAAADPAETVLSASPFTSAPLYDGSYYTIELALEDCLLTQTTTNFAKDGSLVKRVAIAMNLAEIDPARVEASGADVNLWAKDGAHVVCTDLVGESCIVAERPGEMIPMPVDAANDFLKGRKHARVVRALVESCQ